MWEERIGTKVPEETTEPASKRIIRMYRPMLKNFEVRYEKRQIIVKCTTCFCVNKSYEYGTSAHLIRHYLSKHCSEPKCAVCSSTFSSSRAIRTHFQKSSCAFAMMAALPMEYLEELLSPTEEDGPSTWIPRSKLI